MLVEEDEIKNFTVRYETVTRKVFTPDGFEPETMNVAITGVVFEYEGEYLFPCVDEDGVPDNEKMLILGCI